MSPPDAREGSIATWAPPLILASVGMTLGVLPAWIEPLLSDAALTMSFGPSMEAMRADHVVSLGALAAVLGLGVALFVGWDRMHGALEGLHAPAAIRADAWFAAAMAGLPRLASHVTRRIQSGDLRAYTATALAFALGAIGLSLAPPRVAWNLPDLVPAVSPSLVAVAGAVALLVGASIAVCLVRDAFVMLLLSGLVGLASALIFLFLGAPDVAFTQLGVEVAFVVVLASILLRVRRLRSGAPPARPSFHAAPRAALSVAAGAVVAGLVLLGDGFRPDPALTTFFSERSLTEAHGRNVVNVILVDFRGIDTLGEITVVTAGFLAMQPLLRLLRRRRRRDLAPAGAGMSRNAHLLDVAVRGLYPLLLGSAVVLWLRGHHAPGGGFIAGTVAAAATSTLAVARGARVALARMPLGPARLAAAGVLVSLGSGLPALLAGQPFLTHSSVSVPLGVTELELSTTMLFDLGVLAAVWGALGGLCARLLGIDEPPRPAPPADAPGRDR